MRPVWGARFRADHAPLGSWAARGRLDAKRPTRAVEELHQVAATRTERRLHAHVDWLTGLTIRTKAAEQPATALPSFRRSPVCHGSGPSRAIGRAAVGMF